MQRQARSISVSAGTSRRVERRSFAGSASVGMKHARPNPVTCTLLTLNRFIPFE